MNLVFLFLLATHHTNTCESGQEDSFVVDRLVRCPGLAKLYKPDSQEHKAIISFFSEIGSLSVAQIRSGLSQYLTSPDAMRKSNDYLSFKVYALNRFLFDIPSTAAVSRPIFSTGLETDFTSSELWPWMRKGSSLVLSGSVPTFIENMPKYDGLQDFDYLFVKYGLRSLRQIGEGSVGVGDSDQARGTTGDGRRQASRGSQATWMKQAR